MSQPVTKPPWIERLINNSVFSFFASLKLGVILLLVLSGVLAFATVFESLYGTQAVKIIFYGSCWFGGFLVLLGLNVLCSALSRYPWKGKQIGFLVTHFGIIVLLVGSFLTMQFGLDGSIPVQEGMSENRVVIPGLQLVVRNEENKILTAFPVRESAFRKIGKILQVDLSEDRKIIVDEFLPRAIMETQFRESPIAGIGVPAVQVEIKNTVFFDKRWILGGGIQGESSSAMLGPILVTFKEHLSSKEDKIFLTGSEKHEAHVPSKGKGMVVISYQGKELRFRVEEALNKWKKAGDFRVFIEKYYSHAVVVDGKLINKSLEPVNPALSLKVQDKGGNEKSYKTFALFPEFSSFHKGKNQHKEDLLSDVKVRFVSEAVSQAHQKFHASKAKNKMELACSSEGKLLFKLLDAQDKIVKTGQLEAGAQLPLNVQGLTFHVKSWLRNAVESRNPRYIEQINQSESDQFASAIHLFAQDERGAQKGIWVMEGNGGVLAVGSSYVTVQLRRQTVLLPFRIFLERFNIVKNPGSDRAASYESRVRVVNDQDEIQKTALIKMNEPLEYGKYSFYQSSYQLSGKQRAISIFSVNHDPGRWMKYLGSILLVLGIALMFYLNPHYWDLFFKGRKNSP